jgi:hypothetical protein
MIFFAKSAQIKSFLSTAETRLSPRAMTHLLNLVTAFLLHWGRMTASKAGHSICTQPRHRANVARFLARIGWSSDWLECLRVAVLLLEQESRRGGIWIFLLDQTNCSQQGSTTENAFSTGNRTRRPCKGRRYSKKKHAPRRVHAFVMGLLITPGGLRLPMSKCYFTKEYCDKKARNGAAAPVHKTQAELGAGLILELAQLSLPESARVIVLGDTAYEAKSIREACRLRNYSWIVPLNPERVLAGVKPRPKVRTLATGPHAELTANRFVPIRLVPTKGRHVAQRRLSTHRIGPKAKGRTYYVCAEMREVHSIGMVRLAFSCKEKPTKDGPIPLSKILMTNDASLTGAQIVELYGLRWQIELFFKELKSTLGMHQYRFRQFERVAGWVDAALTAFLYAEWVRGRKLRNRRLSEERKRWWRSQRTYGICRAIRQESETKELQELSRLSSTKTGLKKLRRLLRAAQPPEYRIAC